jgi:hypothetical protein
VVVASVVLSLVLVFGVCFCVVCGLSGFAGGPRGRMQLVLA